ncbi:helix-turn-helix domain-containing protein [Myxococcus faecalis]|uniref:transposase n=1 Tax=Myxococcus faecalis TaxID=3115646 RepID=UPI003CFA8E52
MSEPSKISRPRTLDLRGRIKGAAALTLRAVEFGFYHLLLTTVDRVSRLPRNTTMPEAARLYRENIALKAQFDALEAELAQRTEPAPTPMATRAAQVFAYLLTRGDEPFQRYFLSASLRTIRRWATRFRSLRRRPATGGRPPLDEKVVELILTLKRENRAWGQRRIREELRRMGIRVSEPTIARIFRENGFSPRPGRKLDFERVRSTAKDALWALDFFAVQTAKGVWLQALLIIDVHTRELLDLRVHDGWDVDSVWTIRTFNEVCAREKRAPKAVVHDHGTHFAGQFARQLRVLEIEEEVTLTGLPSMNCYAARAIGSVRRELLRHIRVADAKELQFYLDEYRRYANTERPHQGIDGRTPEEFAASKPEAAVIDLADVRKRRPYANGILQGYALVADASPAKAA